MRHLGRNLRRLRFEQLEHRQMFSAAPSSAAALDDLVATPLVGMPQSASSSATGSAAFSPPGFHPNQINRAYGFDAFGSSRGQGQTIAIVDAYHDPTIAHDLQVFDKQYGLPAPPKLNVVTLDPAKAVDPALGWPIETAIDVEWAHAVAPGATILLVEAKSAIFGDLISAVDVASATPGVSVVSMSFGVREASVETVLDHHFASHPGITYVAGSGDDGAPPLFPSVSTFVVSVGGTELKTDASGNYKSEVPWVHGGGGTSAFYNEPDFQTNAGIQTGGKRGTPDIAFNSVDYSIYNSADPSVMTGWMTENGTSCSTPVAAGMFAIVNQQRKAIGNQPLHSADADMYSVYQSPTYTAAFHDISSGYINTDGSTPFIYAAKGYDLASGLGSARGEALIPLLAAMKETASGAASRGTSVADASLQSLLGSAQFAMAVPLTAGASVPAPVSGIAGSTNGSGTEVAPPVVSAQSASLPLATATRYVAHWPTSDSPTGDHQESDPTLAPRKRPAEVTDNGDDDQHEGLIRRW